VVLVGLVKDNYVTSVHPDGIQGGYLGIRHLISLGHRRIGCVTGYNSGHSNTELRLTGYKKALSEAGIEFEPELVVEGKFSIGGAASATRSLLELPVPPTAIYSVSDPMAIGVYKAVQENGLQIPRDISVVGFDDIKLAAHLFPGLTTVGMNKYEMVKTAVQVLLDQIDGKSKSKSNMEITFPVRLIERNSCRRLG
jgi:LacI family transcriptional regulator